MHQHQFNVRITIIDLIVLCFQLIDLILILLTEIAQDRFVPHESTDHFLQKNNRNRVKTQAIYKECKFAVNRNILFPSTENSINLN